MCVCVCVCVHTCVYVCRVVRGTFLSLKHSTNQPLIQSFNHVIGRHHICSANPIFIKCFIFVVNLTSHHVVFMEGSALVGEPKLKFVSSETLGVNK
ncbi:hypothetical protein LSH36_298g04089 [Paralvinella palmiformis]|uniref:Uncharacterized protein n=1 Tax=Paralvinella palmiformis TaxID=53620 RepID=A0AAD9N396_9ANNE|nr:hypothetical protein LSH36_298g04089 [Paralvinella palmiformis]